MTAVAKRRVHKREHEFYRITIVVAVVSNWKSPPKNS